MNNLREIRQRRGLVMWAVAARAGVHPSLLSGVERHDYLPGPTVRERIAVALAVTVTDIWPNVGTEVRYAAQPR